MSTPPPKLDIKNVQGDILEGLGKKHQVFHFFSIRDATNFRRNLRAFIPLITDTTEAKKFHQTIKEAKKEASLIGKPLELLENSGVNISFTQKGLLALGINDDIRDDIFKAGMLKDAPELGDKTEVDWDPKFKKDIHGVIIVTANSKAILDATLAGIKVIFLATIIDVKTLFGHTRPGPEDGHEHFGFNDGLTQPAVKDVDAGVIKEPNEDPVRQGIVLLGREGDDVPRPTWALDGSFLAFRYLKQLVPEFDNFLETNALHIPADMLGARLVGRWKSGAPVVLTPTRDDPTLAHAQDFAFNPASQEKCPFAAHIRKTNPRGDLPSTVRETRRIIRRGIAFGPEVRDDERKAKKSSQDPLWERGLLFACYQSNLGNGFHFMQKQWANNRAFPPTGAANPPVPDAGIDPIIGVGAPRDMVGANAADPTKVLDFSQQWVVPKGGEYFFSPSIPALNNTFVLPLH
ncbi:Dyp-type peroxidase [Xylaria palmicola]|nr:Dyp-type peroxidase [Xylaria palmicola]